MVRPSASVVSLWPFLFTACTLYSTSGAFYTNSGAQYLSHPQSYDNDADAAGGAIIDDSHRLLQHQQGGATDGYPLLQYLLSKSNQRYHGDQLADDIYTSTEGDDKQEVHLSGTQAFLAAQQQRHPHKRAEVVPVKRFTDFGLPYYKYKRNNGIWIWMPAQGYVSVPKDQQALANADANKQGKIMRYGK